MVATTVRAIITGSAVSVTASLYFSLRRGGDKTRGARICEKESGVEKKLVHNVKSFPICTWDSIIKLLTAWANVWTIGQSWAIVLHDVWYHALFRQTVSDERTGYTQRKMDICCYIRHDGLNFWKKRLIKIVFAVPAGRSIPTKLPPGMR